jgi:hypothetical protein
MATNITGDWRELFDVALFEPNRVKLRRRIERAKQAINNRLDILRHDNNENERLVSERIALSDALTTLAELHNIVFARTASPKVGRRDDTAAGQADLR